MSPMNDIQCPYGANECPKVEDTNRDISEIKKRVINIERILYVIVGIITVECGIVVW